MSTSHIANTEDCPLAGALAARMRTARDELVRHWLARIVARVDLPTNQIFPTDELLNHMPLLIDGIADYLEDPASEISTDMPVVAKAIELGELRHAQHFDAHEILKEYELLGGILFRFLAAVVDEMPEPCEKSELLACGHRVFRAIAIIQQTTTTQYLRLAEAQVAEREDQLRAFNRMLSHEIKNHVGAILGASEVLDAVELPDEATRRRFLGIVGRNARALKQTLDSLVVLSRLEGDSRSHRHVKLAQAVAEARRQVREAALATGVEIRSAVNLPDVEVNAPVVELALTNYLSNAIKYSRPDRPDRFAEISAYETVDGLRPELVVCVQDNGMGVPADKRERLFERFYRAHDTVTAVEGTGLGLSIVREIVESLGGRVWAEFGGGGSKFMFALPQRRRSKVG